MRRTASVILFVLGAWILAAEVMMASLDVGQGIDVRLGMIGVLAALAAPLLLLGMWASPGNRVADLGMTLMIAAGVGAAIDPMMGGITHDPGFSRAMPPGQTVPQFQFAVLWGLLNLIIVAGGGYLL
jgi:hypothetical protein